MNEPQGDWSEYQRLVMSKLESLEKGQEATRLEVGNLRVDMGMLRVKSGLWGAVAGVIPGVAFLLYQILGGKKSN